MSISDYVSKGGRDPKICPAPLSFAQKQAATDCFLDKDKKGQVPLDYVFVMLGVLCWYNLQVRTVHYLRAYN